MLFFRSYFFKGSETDLNKLVQKQLALNSTRVTLESFQPNNLLISLLWFDGEAIYIYIYIYSYNNK